MKICGTDGNDYLYGFGNAALSLYLAMALLSLKLWQLADLAGPLVVILTAQTLTMALYAAFL